MATNKTKEETSKNEGLEREFKIKVTAKEIAASIDKELGNLSRKLKVPGFRPGKVPATLVKQRYGASVRSDVINDEIRRKVQSVITDNKIRTISGPSIEDLKAEEGKDLEFTIKMEIFPEIPMPEFKKINLEKPQVTVAAKDVDDYLKKLAKDNVIFPKASKSKAEKGDEVTIDFVGTVDSVAFEGGSMNGHKLVLGSGTFIPGFEDQLIGAKADDDIVVKVKFPETYHAKELAGKKAEFKTKLHEVRKPEISEVDEEFAKRFGLENLEAFKKRVHDMLSTSFDDDILTIMKMRLFDDLEGSLSFDVPATMFDREFEMIKSQAGNAAEEEKDDKKAVKKKPDSKKDEETYRRIALRRVRIGLLLADYAEKNRIKLESSDLQAAIMKQARMFPGQERVIFDYFTKNEKALESLKGPALEEKAVKSILGKEVTIKAKEYSIKEIEKMLKEENDREIL